MYVCMYMCICICVCVYIYIYIYIYIYTRRNGSDRALLKGLAIPRSETGEVLLMAVGTLGYFLILSENSACQVPICAVAA